MLNEYFGLMKRSVTNSFKKEYYKDWWAVPASERMAKAGLLSGLTVAILYVIMTTVENKVIGGSVSVFILVFVFLPFMEKVTEDLIKKYKK